MPLLYFMPNRVDSVGILSRCLVKNRTTSFLSSEKEYNDMLSRFDLIHECDGWMYRLA